MIKTARVRIKANLEFHGGFLLLGSATRTLPNRVKFIGEGNPGAVLDVNPRKLVE